MEHFNIIWNQYIAPIFGGLTLTTILTGIIYALIRGFIIKLIKKINIEKVEEKAVNKGIEKIEKITFQHDITPLVKSNLEMVNEIALKDFKELLSNNNKQYSYLINILKQFSSYFDDSISISADKKIKLQKLFADAETMIAVDIAPVESEIIIEEPIVEKKEKKVIKR